MTYIPTDMPEQISVNGIRTEIATMGEGPPILYLHSAGGADQSAAYLQALAKQYKVILPSHPGFGASELPEHYTSIDDLAFFYRDFIDTLDIPQLTLAGSSFGAWLAAEIAVMCSDKINALVLASPLGIKISGREKRDITDILTLDWGDLPETLFFKQREAIAFENLPDAIVHRMVRNRETLALMAWSPTLYNPKLKHRLHRIKVPTLVLWGAEDRVVNLEYGAAFSDAIEDAQFEVIPEAGHYLAYDQPEIFVNCVESFCSTIGESP